jgi:hypothetical protein
LVEIRRQTTRAQQVSPKFGTGWLPSTTASVVERAHGGSAGRRNAVIPGDDAGLPIGGGYVGFDEILLNILGELS